jgi:signal transduction histidine kinase
MAADKAIRLLLIEANDADARLVAAMLSDVPGQPFQLERVSLLSDGLELLTTSAFDLLLLGLCLPKKAWREILVNVRNLAPELAIVILTAVDEEDVAARMLRLGAQDYMIKSHLEPRNFGRALRHAIERKHLENALREAKVKEELDHENERERIGMDLHDGVMQDIYGVSLSLEMALADLHPSAESTRSALEKSIDQLHSVIGDIRSYIFDLRPTGFDGDLGSTLRDLSREFQQDSGVATVVEIDGDFQGLPHAHEMAFYHIAHEALSNVRKHAGPNQVSISLSCVEGQLTLEVRDDGAGFDAARALPQQHRGMRNMLSRARDIGAEFSVRSVPGEGTVITAAMPRPTPLTRQAPPDRDAA